MKQTFVVLNFIMIALWWQNKTVQLHVTISNRGRGKGLLLFLFFCFSFKFNCFKIRFNVLHEHEYKYTFVVLVISSCCCCWFRSCFCSIVEFFFKLMDFVETVPLGHTFPQFSLHCLKYYCVASCCCLLSIGLKIIVWLYKSENKEHFFLKET